MIGRQEMVTGRISDEMALASITSLVNAEVSSVLV